MSVLVFGILLIIAIMFTVMGIPFILYLRRDMAWESLENKSPETWYH